MSNQEPLQRVSKEVRFANYLIDGILVSLLDKGIKLVLGLEMPEMASLADVSLLLNYMLLSLFITFCYYLILETTSSATVGKLLTNTRVIQTNGEPLSAFTAFKRSLCRLIPFNALSFLFYQNTGWHDTISNTMVITKTDFEKHFNLA